jgi:hypothetical protein
LVTRIDRTARRRGSRRVYARRRAVALASAAILVGALIVLALPSGHAPPAAARSTPAAARSTHSAARSTHAASGVRPGGHSVALAAAVSPIVTVPPTPGPGWTVVATVLGRPAVWLAQRGGVTLLRFDQSHTRVDLHAGSIDGGATGWRYGDQIAGREIHRIIAGFNGGFKLSYTNVGFVAGGHVAAPLRRGLASIVTYANGTTDIGTWGEGVPRSGQKVFSVLQNQLLLVDNGVAASTVSTCILTCWGATVGGLTVVARSALGVTANGQLVWAAGEHLTPADLASALIAAGAVRAIELDINPDWVAGYLYVHHAGGPSAVPVVPGQLGIAGQLLTPDTRDFLTVVATS